MLIASIIILFGIVVNGVDINYATSGAGIRGFSYTATDPQSSSQPGPFTFDCDEKQTDGDLTADGGCSSDVTKYTWGSSDPGTGINGMDGDFMATDVQPGTNAANGNVYARYDITKAAIVFQSDGCIKEGSGSKAATGTLVYTDAAGTAIVNTISVDVSAVSTLTNVYRFEADLSDVEIQLAAGASIGFKIQTNRYCESSISVTEFELEGVPVETAEPTKAPSPGPTFSPTTSEPTMAPTASCKGEVTWGDPHFRLMAFDNDLVNQFNYQGLGWYFYIAPCDMSTFEDFPFFLMSYHTRCYWRNNPKGCINNNKLILNTKPNPWIIEFSESSLAITVGSGTYSVDDDGDGTYDDKINVNKNYKKNKPLDILYNDDNTLPGQQGQLQIYYEKGVIVVRLYNVQFDALPRGCNRNEGRGELLQCGPNVCEDLVIDIRNKGSWTYFTCPHCLRNIACGLMGKYYRGDCTQSQMNDPTNGCSQILVGADGKVYTDNSGRAKGDSVFGQMADTWAYDAVVNTLSTTHGYTINFAKEKNTLFKHKKTVPEGRSLEITDASYYDGYCNNNMTHIRIVNETCRLATVVEYAKCCKEIGICNMLWLGCIEDYCSCTEPDADKPANITDAWCLKEIISKSMNTTCGVDALYPTATPTTAPTPSPTGLVAGLPQGEKAADLIWLYLIFVVLFVVIAGVAYWYYRKKNVGGKASFQEDVDMAPTTGTTY